MNKFVISSLSSLVILSLATACAPSKRAATPTKLNKAGANPQTNKANNNGSNNPDSSASTVEKLSPSQIKAQPVKDTLSVDVTKIKNINSYISSASTDPKNTSDSVVTLDIDSGTGTDLIVGAAVDSSTGALVAVPKDQKGVSVSCDPSVAVAASDYATKGAAACSKVVFLLNVSAKNSSGTVQNTNVKVISSRGNNYKASLDFADDKNSVDSTMHQDLQGLATVSANTLTVTDSSGADLTDKTNNKQFNSFEVQGLVNDTTTTTVVKESVVVAAGTSSEKHFNVAISGFPKNLPGANGLSITPGKPGSVDASNVDAPKYIRQLVVTQKDGTAKVSYAILTIDTKTVVTEDQLKAALAGVKPSTSASSAADSALDSSTAAAADDSLGDLGSDASTPDAAASAPATPAVAPAKSASVAAANTAAAAPKK